MCLMGNKVIRNLLCPHTCFPEFKLAGLAFRSQENKNLLSDIDAYGGAEYAGSFPLFLKKPADVLSPKTAVILHKCARPGNFSTSWKVANVALCQNLEATALVLLITVQLPNSVLSKVFEHLVTKFECLCSLAFVRA